jgi:RNA polymerase sigma factor (sigma-70 family)
MDSLASMVQAYRSAQTLEAKRAAAEAIIREMHPRLWHYLRARLNSDHEAQDILQETLVGIFKNLPLFRGESSSDMSGFCFGIAKNKLNTFLARKSRNLEDSGIDDNLLDLLESLIAVEPEDPFKHEELRRALGILKASRPQCIRYFELRFVLSLTYREMGDILGINKEDSVRYLVEGCLERAKKLFA